jgi:hypothetical protein
MNLTEKVNKMSDDITVSQAEVEAVEKEVNEKLAAETVSKNESLAKKVRAEVETEFKRKAEIAKLQEDLKKQSEEIKKAQEEAQKAKAEAEAKVKELESTFRKELEDVTAVRRGIAAENVSPFQAQSNTNPNIRVVNGKTIDVSNKAVMDDIEEQSRIALMKSWGIDPNLNPEWGKAPEKYR